MVLLANSIYVHLVSVLLPACMIAAAAVGTECKSHTLTIQRQAAAAAPVQHCQAGAHYAAGLLQLCAVGAWQ